MSLVLTEVMLAVVEIVGAAPVPGLGIDRRLLPYPVQAAGENQLARSRSDSLADFMARNLSGVNVNEVSGSLYQNDISYRGFRASPVLGTAQGMSVYLDGVRVNEPFGDVINWDMVPEAAIGNVLLVPGSNPMYGLNTLGGALALTTRSGLEQQGLEAELSAGSAGRRRFDVSHGARQASGWHSFVAATLFDDAGWRDHSAGRIGNLFAKAGHSGARGDWHVSLLAGRSTLRGNGLLPDSLYQQDRRAVFTFPDLTRNRLVQGTFHGRHRFDGDTELAGVAYARSSRRATVNGDVGDADGEGEFNTTSTRQHSHGASTNLSLHRRAHRIDLGVTVDRSEVAFAQFEQAGILTPERGVVPDPRARIAPASSVAGSSRAFGLYAADTWTVAPAMHVTASARYNHARVNNTLTSARGPQPAESFSYARLNPSIGFVREYSAGPDLFANLARNNRVPTVIELGCADPEQPCQLPVGLQSDPYLKQVVASTAEAGLRWQHGVLSLYRTVNRDDILFLSSGRTRLGYFSNFGRTRHQGLDASHTVVAGALAFRASYSFLQAEYDADGDLFTGVRTVRIAKGSRIAGLPKHTVKLSADWKLSRTLALGADAQAMSSLGTQGNEDGLLADPEAGEAPHTADLRVRGYGLVNLRASWKPVAGWELHGRVNNVLNRRHETFGAVSPNPLSADSASNVRFVAPGAPRSVTLGARYRF
ncbi:MAG: TonB-dependent receptor [Pseudomonadota bacterium]